jgi:hypothetical protein
VQSEKGARAKSRALFSFDAAPSQARYVFGMLSRPTPVGFYLLGVMLALATGCGGDDSVLTRRGGELPDTSEGGATGVEPSGGGAVAFCDALTVVRAKCQRCHGNPLQNAAPVPFLTYDDFKAQYGTTEFTYGEVAVGAVERDIMPYVALNEPPSPVMPPVEPLTAAEKATLLGWLKQGALPEGGTDCP